MLAVFAGGTAWAFRTHFEHHVQDQVADLRNQRRESDGNRRTILAHVQNFIDESGLRQWWGDRLTTQDLMTGDLLAQAARRSADLERAQLEFRRILQVRRRLSLFRGQLQLQQRDLSRIR